MVASVDRYGSICINHFGFRTFAEIVATMVMLKD